MIPGFPLSLYDIKNDSKLYIEFIETEEPVYFLKIQDYDFSANFYQKLGLTKNLTNYAEQEILEASLQEEFESENPSKTSYSEKNLILSSPKESKELATEEKNFYISFKLKKLVKVSF